jgi:alkanesulfonate monooxygenase SsuD/methylene tetrahydromethanopterin reductase-like flavin-dependent oxidoreductase (luciferase family)
LTIQQTGNLRFGSFIAPFHSVADDPTLAIERDMQLVQHLDELGYDEVWIGEHHSAGYESRARQVERSKSGLEPASTHFVIITRSFWRIASCSSIIKFAAASCSAPGPVNCRATPSCSALLRRSSAG